ncbi:nuclear transport factor 2 family protein [Actinokineospora soli]|uniref:Nuclear transport factor 2 family protein n=1 Tax=Actinokineospora soli TaxID=1048753 RepID=A0ABW2TLV8_9PSEU
MHAEILDWFAEYDARAARGDIAGLADLAVFPLNVVTDIPGGAAAARTWDREEFIEVMTEVVGEGAELRSTRTPHLLGDNLAVVFTDASVTVDGHDHQMRYADILIRTTDGWAFQTMVQPGHGTGWEPARRG